MHTDPKLQRFSHFIVLNMRLSTLVPCALPVVKAGDINPSDVRVTQTADNLEMPDIQKRITLDYETSVLSESLKAL